MSCTSPAKSTAQANRVDAYTSRTLSRLLAILLSGAILHGCTVNSECARAICGCWKNYTKPTEIKVADLSGQPSGGVSLACEATQEHHGPSNEIGLISARIKGRVSPGCGFAAICEVATIRDHSGATIGSVQFGQLLQGRETTSGNLAFKLIADGT